MDRAYLENRPPRWPWLLFGLMTITTFGGPVLIYLALQGGESPVWPPDQFSEWVVFFAVVSLVLTLFLMCMGLAFVRRDDMNRLVRPRSERPEPPTS